MDKKIFISIAVGIATMFLVYIGLQSSLNKSSFSRLPILPETAISIVLQEEQKYKKEENLTNTDLNNFSTRYVYIKGNGTIFESNVNSNSIGKYIGKTDEPTITTGNHFAWEVKNKKDNSTYYVDHVTGAVVAKSFKR
jgi:hypothetical protein